jgi:hypothetical protein
VSNGGRHMSMRNENGPRLFRGVTFGVVLAVIALLCAVHAPMGRVAAAPATRVAPARPMAGAPQANLRFSHKTHHAQGVECARCHIPAPKEEPSGMPAGWRPLRPSRVVPGVTPRTTAPVVEQQKGAAGTFGRPAEARCLSCHFKTRAKADCNLCHLGTPGHTNRTRTRVRSEVTFPHPKHERTDCLECHPQVTDWENLDGVMQQTSMESCLRCHDGRQAKKTCVLCHSPTPYPRDHTRNYEVKHGIAYRADPRRCRMCHDDSSCVACHSRRPRSHTLAWTARRHGMVARTQPDKCTACHLDRSVCRRCHPNQ